MQKLPYIRYLTYIVLIAIAVVATKKQYFIEVPLEPQPFVPTQDVSDWNGKSESWLRQNMTGNQLTLDIESQASSADLDPGARTILKKEFPDYHGRIKQIKWTKHLGGLSFEDYEVYLIQQNDGWIVLAASRTDEQMVE